MAILLRHKNSIFGLQADLDTLTQSIADEAAARAAADGDLATLSTTDKTSLVSAINEVFTTASAGASSGSTSLQIANNLSDLADVAIARTNLDVYSTTEVTNAISAAQLAAGTNFNVATIAERDALGTANQLDLADRVFVNDDGTGQWALYKPATIDGVSGDVTSWVTLSTQTSFESTSSAAAIKTSYESNPDTNAFTDAEKATLSFITATAAINLDTDVVLKANLSQDLTLTTGVDVAPSVDAVVAYADAVAASAGGVPTMEDLTVNADQITLSAEPKGGIAGIGNFGTVRYTDVNGVSYDAPLVATANPLVWTISVDTAGQWDTFQVKVQYLAAVTAAQVSGGGAL